MPKFRVANVYVIRCVHEIEADNDQQAIEKCMDLDDGLEATVSGRYPGQRLGIRAKYGHTYIVEEIKEE
jgi:hypothetical protein